MNRYYLNIVATENGDNEIHNEFCLYVPVIINAKYLGDFSDPKTALEEALKNYPNANGCKHCCSSSHIEYELE